MLMMVNESSNNQVPAQIGMEIIFQLFVRLLLFWSVLVRSKCQEANGLCLIFVMVAVGDSFIKDDWDGPTLQAIQGVSCYLHMFESP